MSVNKSIFKDRDSISPSPKLVPKFFHVIQFLSYSICQIPSGSVSRRQPGFPLPDIMQIYFMDASLHLSGPFLTPSSFFLEYS